jgi:hypothetical protein
VKGLPVQTDQTPLENSRAKFTFYNITNSFSQQNVKFGVVYLAKI